MDSVGFYIEAMWENCVAETKKPFSSLTRTAIPGGVERDWYVNLGKPSLSADRRE